MKLLYTIKEVFSSEGFLREQAKDYYNIPLYQRGYKWTSKEVRKLLDDIKSFKEVDEKFYCLQNITLVPFESCFNVVDGQQRLTTLTLLLTYLGEAKLAKDRVKFPEKSIRNETNEFINKIIINHESGMNNHSWEEFIRSHRDFDHQDIYHLFAAYNEIDNWFTENGDCLKKEDFLHKLLNCVKLIVNQIDTRNDEEEIFGNLNSKRIPLDGADLFRAILITRVASEEQKKEANIKDIIQLNEKRIKIGWEFDQINNWWSQDAVKEYFKSYIRIKSETTGTDLKLFDTVKHPINLLLFIFAESKNVKILSLDLIENYNDNATALYREILDLHYTLVDWYEDRNIYHFLGFLFAHTKTNFSIIWKKWKGSIGRQDFINALKKDIEKVIFRENLALDFSDPKIDWYHDESKLLVPVLILLDVINSLDESQVFMHPKYFSKNLNDIEHIFPQNPADVKEKKEFVEFLNYRLDGEKFDLSEYDTLTNSKDYMEDVEEFIKQHISSIRTNSIGNLVLLYYSLNRSFGRISYAKKRSRVIEYFNKGGYIQPHTFRVFVRYFTDGESDTKELEHWTNKDIEANAKAIDNKIKGFFS